MSNTLSRPGRSRSVSQRRIFIRPARRIWPALFVVLALGLAVRLILMPQPEPFPADLSTYWQPWAIFGGEHGLAALYIDGVPVVNYPPLYIVILSGLGRLGRWLNTAEAPTAWQLVLIKLPAVLADLAVTLLLFLTLFRRKPHASHVEARSLAADQSWLAVLSSPPVAVAALWALNPAVIYVSAYWGQVDSLHTFWMVAALLAALTGRWSRAGALMGLGLLTKLQAIVLLPLLVYLAWRWEWQALGRVLSGLLAALTLGLLPFAINGSLSDVLGVYTGSVGFYPRLTLNAYNFWWPPYFLGERLGGVQLTDGIRLFGLFTLRSLGLGLLAAFILLLLGALWRGEIAGKRGRKPERANQAAVLLDRLRPAQTLVSVQTAFFAAGMLVFGFFMLPTEIHERYMLPALAFLALAVWRDRRLLLAYGLLTASVFLNLLEVLPFANWVYRLWIFLPGERMLLALLNVALFVWFSRRFLREAAMPSSQQDGVSGL